MHGCQVLWAIKDDAIGNTFFDEGAATFFLPHLVTKLPVSEEKQKNAVKRMKYGIETVENNKCGLYTHTLLCFFIQIIHNSRSLSYILILTF